MAYTLHENIKYGRPSATDKEINDLVMKNEEIQNECTVIDEKIISAKVFG